MATEDEAFIAWVRQTISARGLSLRQVAMLSGLHHSNVSRLLNGERAKMSYATAIPRGPGDR